MQKILDKLILSGIPSPRLEAQMIMNHASDKTEALSIVEKRISGCPLDKLLGRKSFYKYDFVVDENVLSPRPDTEILVEEAINIVKDNHFSILDLGTGSGCIILSVLADCPNAKGVAVDISPQALDVARSNADLLNLNNRIEFINASWFEDTILGSFDVILSNPPYIPSKDITSLDIEVREHDPLLALDGGADGYDSYRMISKLSKKILKPQGYILLEVGINQAEYVASIFTQEDFLLLDVLKDLSQTDRCLVFRAPL